MANKGARATFSESHLTYEEVVRNSLQILESIDSIPEKTYSKEDMKHQPIANTANSTGEPTSPDPFESEFEDIPTRDISEERMKAFQLGIGKFKFDESFHCVPYTTSLSFEDQLVRLLSSSQRLNKDTITKFITWVKDNNFQYVDLVGCYYDNRLAGLIEKMGINYFKDSGALITNILRDFVEAGLHLYHPAQNFIQNFFENPCWVATYDENFSTYFLPEEERNEVINSKDTQNDYEHDIDCKEPITKYYEITETVLGEGEFGVVLLGISIHKDQEVAIKLIDKNRLSESQPFLENEIEILRQCRHPNIVSLLGVFQSEENLYIVMELVRGGELYDEIVRRKTFSEKDASFIMSQVFSALIYLHNKGIIHRDLKLENLLLVDNKATGKDIVVKIADFGLSRIYQGNLVQTACGTPFYVAPEVLLGTGYSMNIDMWSSGIMLYILLSGRLPFHAASDIELFDSILEGRFVFKSPQFDQVSEEAKDLISKLIKVDASKRLSAEMAIKHPFITSKQTEEPLHESLYTGLSQLSISRRMK
eukprot:TRINITY_DN3196_c0_g1_i1.p1 TRINITY_DN3196_c0_g1~~TRINITY_DN3196_c0_g1_i1.p1  ORF type:complete len:536 (-),score=106.70 TRINITY_DN3196_c0_g1_i1:51-1658(-)